MEIWSPGSGIGRAWIAHGLLTVAAIAAAAYAFRRNSSRYRNRAVGIIPARYKSSRFDGKPLVQILGKPMIQRTWEQAKLAVTLDHVVVATDDEKIAECCQGFGADALSVAMKLSRSSRKNMILPEIIDGVIKALQRAPDAVFSTAVTSLKPEDAFDPNWVKCVVDKHGYAIYFSRSLLPCNKSGEVNPKFPYVLHLGIQSYDSNFLKIYPQLLPTPLQLEEDLEQLKVLENGYKMKVIKVDHDAHCVDTPADVEKIGALMWERNISCRHASRCGKDGSSDVGKKIS
ncbi:hypothetical protein AMTRI_Chr01g135430 [Amborella trichopoda]